MRRINKCSVDDEKAMFFGEDGGFDDVVHTVNEKLMLNRDLAFNVFNKVACELESSNSYDWLRIEVSSIIDNEEREHNLQANLKIWSELADKLRNTQRTIEEEFQMQKKKIINDVSELAANIDSSYCDNNDKLDYIQRWEASKLEQQNLRQWIEEEALLNEIKLLETNRKKHLKVSRELQLYGLQTIDTTEEEITAWTQRYNDELERRTQEINDLESKIEETNEYIEQQLELQKQRQELIDEYMGDQLKMQAEADYWNEVHRSAALIQAHWRGYMVRHELGQYEGILKRPKRRKRKRKKKKK